MSARGVALASTAHGRLLIFLIISLISHLHYLVLYRKLPIIIPGLIQLGKGL